MPTVVVFPFVPVTAARRSCARGLVEGGGRGDGGGAAAFAHDDARAAGCAPRPPRSRRQRAAAAWPAQKLVAVRVDPRTAMKEPGVTTSRLSSVMSAALLRERARGLDEAGRPA